MKLLFDENLSPHLVEALSGEFPGSTHVRDVGLQSADDWTVWEFAKANDFIVVSKDSDFHQLSFLLGPPPKVIWVKVGNADTVSIESLLRSRRIQIEEFDSEGEVSLIHLVGKGVFGAWEDPAFFSRVAIDPESGRVVWPGGIDLAPDALYAPITGGSTWSINPRSS